jgi:hypothetical protein
LTIFGADNRHIRFNLVGLNHSFPSELSTSPSIYK